MYRYFTIGLTSYSQILGFGKHCQKCFAVAGSLAIDDSSQIMLGRLAASLYFNFLLIPQTGRLEYDLQIFQRRNEKESITLTSGRPVRQRRI